MAVTRRLNAQSTLLFVAAMLTQAGVATAQDAPADPRDAAHFTLSPTRGLSMDAPGLDAHLELHLTTWVRLETDVVGGAQTTPAVTVPLVRPVMDARLLGQRLRIFIQPELAAGSPRLLDAFIEVNFNHAAKLRAGQFRTPFSRAFINPIVALQLPDRGLVDDQFRLGRDTGVMFFGGVADKHLEYYAGVFNGAQINNLFGDLPAPMGIARLVYSFGTPVPYDQVPCARGSNPTGLSLGIDGAFRRRQTQSDPMAVNEDSWHASVDAALSAGLVSATAEGFLRGVKPSGGEWTTDWGAFVQGGVFVLPQAIELAARVGCMNPQSTGADAFLQSYEVDLNGYYDLDGVALGHHLKASARYALDHTRRSYGPGLDSGTRHRATVQVQLWM